MTHTEPHPWKVYTSDGRPLGICQRYGVTYDYYDWGSVVVMEIDSEDGIRLVKVKAMRLAIDTERDTITLPEGIV
jgi:hypothetical protein